MQYFLSKKFEKHFSKLPAQVKKKARERLELFVTDPMDDRLGNHSLSGKWRDCKSINITGDMRAIYTMVDKDVVLFIDIGSHSELYE